MYSKKNYKYKDESKALKRRKQRLNANVLEMLKTNRAIFLTLTFNDETLSKTNAKTRERYIKEYLNKQCCYKYICNCDYGKKNKREHYHALLIIHNLKSMFFDSLNDFKKSNRIDLKAWKYGNINASFKNAKQENNIKDHFTKETTKNSKIIYSKAKYKKDFKNIFDYEICFLKSKGFIIHNERSIKDEKAINKALREQDEIIKNNLNIYANYSNIDLLNIDKSKLNKTDLIIYNYEIKKRNSNQDFKELFNRYEIINDFNDL